MPDDRADDGTRFGPVPRSAAVALDEIGLVRELFGPSDTPRLMLDVGAHRGSSAVPMLRAGWTVLAFEPDAENRAALAVATARLSLAPGRFSVEAVAVGDTEATTATLYRSPVSSGVSSLVPFLDSHAPAAEVAVRRLDAVLAERGITAVDFLKIDVEGLELPVLRGFPFDRIRPDAVLVEYEDGKTLAHGFGAADLLAMLDTLGYRAFVSEWHAIEQYGGGHDWKALFPWQRGDAPPDPQGWGNLLFLSPALAARCGNGALGAAFLAGVASACRSAGPKLTPSADQPPTNPHLGTEPPMALALAARAKGAVQRFEGDLVVHFAGATFTEAFTDTSPQTVVSAFGITLYAVAEGTLLLSARTAGGILGRRIRLRWAEGCRLRCSYDGERLELAVDDADPMVLTLGPLATEQGMLRIGGGFLKRDFKGSFGQADFAWTDAAGKHALSRATAQEDAAQPEPQRRIRM